MSYIRNISAGENIIIENLGDDSIRIHNSYSQVDVKLPLSTYFDYQYYQAKLDEGDENYYLHIKNCIFKINGNWHEIPDIYFSPLNSCIYDMYLRIQETISNESVAEKRLDIQVVIKFRSDDQMHIPEYPYDHHIFRFTSLHGHLEIIRMVPHFLDITCVKGGFLAYHNYQGVLVRNKSGLNLTTYQGIPTYSERQGAMLLETPIEKNGILYTPRNLAYDGKDYIFLGKTLV